MSKKSEEQKTLRDMLTEMSQYCRKIEKIRNEIDKRYGVGLYVSSIPGWQCSAEIIVKRGIEEVGKTIGKDPEPLRYDAEALEVRHYGIKFRQLADAKTKTFVKAWKKPPKVVLVEEDEE